MRAKLERTRTETNEKRKYNRNRTTMTARMMQDGAIRELPLLHLRLQRQQRRRQLRRGRTTCYEMYITRRTYDYNNHNDLILILLILILILIRKETIVQKMVKYCME